jgi:hypothetical protein
MVPSSAIVDGEHLTCGEFSVGKTVHLGNFKFIAEYFGSLSLSPMRGDEGAAFRGSTHSKASTPRQAMIEDSTEVFITKWGKEGSFVPPSPKRCDMGTSLAPATTTSWMENALATQATMTTPPWIAVPWLETNVPIKRCHARHGQR